MSGILQALIGSLGGAPVVVPLPGGTVSSTTATPTNAAATLNFTSTGTVTSSRAGIGSTVSHNWHLAPGAGVGNSFWLRATVTSGTNPTTGSINSWVQLSGTTTWQNSDTLANGLAVTSTLLIEIATDSGGSNVVTSGSYTLTAMKDTA